MLKAPVEGTVKTRLAKEIGSSAATLAYRALVEHQLRQIPHEWEVHICFTPQESRTAMQDWLGSAPVFSAQGSGDLGERLDAASRGHFKTSDRRLVILGGDCPYLDRRVLQNAEAALREADVVLVPALDGGYCLVGLRKAVPTIFREIAWSTAEVLAQTRQRLREESISWVELEPAEDVDDGASWIRAVTSYPHLAGRLA